MLEKIDTLSLIFAIDENNVMGRNNDIPWHSPHDFQWFRSTTHGYNIIMGRKTWESLPKKPLPNRLNYVITSNPDYEAVGAVVKSSLQEAIKDCQRRDIVTPI